MTMKIGIGLLTCVLLQAGCDNQLAPSPATSCNALAAVDAGPQPPACDVPPGYVVFGQGCGGPKINGLTCAVGCVIVDWPDGAYPVDAGRTPLAIGCRLPPGIGGGGICVADCRDCQ